MTGTLHGLYRKEGEERQPEDFYATDPAAVPPLLKVLGSEWESGGKLILEPCCGCGHISQVLDLYGYNVISTDLIDRGYGIGGVDFLVDNPLFDTLPYDAIITNPPFKYATQFIEKSLRLAPVVCMLLRTAFIESERRDNFFKSYPPYRIYSFRKRPRTSKDGKFPEGEQSATPMSWWVWHRGYTGPIIIERI